MLDPKLIRENPKLIEKKALEKGIKINIDHICELDARFRKIDLLVQKLREEKNKLVKAASSVVNKEKAISKGREIGEKLEKEEKALNDLREEYQKVLLTIPNLTKDDVKVGKDESENEVIRKYGNPTKFEFQPKDHLELGETLGIIDVKSAAKVSGPRFAYLKNDGVLLELALKQFAFDTLTKEEFIPIIPPVLIKKEIMEGFGYTQMGEEENIFSLDKDNLYLVGTSEQSIVPMFKDEILNKKDLPKRFVGFSTCFRREAGTYGKDTRGIFRVHQFDKVEMVSFVEEGKDDEEHEYLLSIEEKLFQSLEIPYQVVKMCSGDLGFPAARKYDIEAWIPSQERYREVTSVSTVTDFQSRRLNMKYQDGAQKKYLYVLNGTAYSMNRPIIAILENYQQKDGSILVPEVLQKYINKKVIK
jgi:seryl-tRNA synthetase